jgi:hypothetical protein
MYMKVNTSLCKWDANQWEEKDDTTIFSWGSHSCQHASPCCVDRSLGDLAANWHHPPSPHIRHHKNLPTSEGSSMSRFTTVALRGSSGVSTIPLTKPFFRAMHKLLACFDGDHTTKPSRRWQPPRVTSITGLQLNHLVPNDATSQCNCTKITHSLNRMNTIKQEWVRGIPSTP